MKCLELDASMVYNDINDYLYNELEDCINCQSMNCLMSSTYDPLKAKVKGLAPAKQRRQNNQFSDSIDVQGFEMD